MLPCLSPPDPTKTRWMRSMPIQDKIGLFQKYACVKTLYALELSTGSPLIRETPGTRTRTRTRTHIRRCLFAFFTLFMKRREDIACQKCIDAEMLAYSVRL